MPTPSTPHGPNISSVALMPPDSVVIDPVRMRAVGWLEPCAGKLARTVLRGGRAGNGVSLPDGKARKPCEFGVKAAVVISHQTGLMVGARSFPGNPYDGHILSAILEQAANLLQDLPVKIKVVVGDLGFRGVDADNPDKLIIHRGKFKRLNPQQKAWLRRRQAVEPAIGHLKSDHRMTRCWLKGAAGDALHTISCAAGYNLRWLLRAIARLGIGPAFLCLLQMVPHPAMALQGSSRGADRLQLTVGYVFRGGCLAPQAPPQPPCITRICEPVAAANPAAYPLGTAAGTRLRAGALWSQPVTTCCRYSKASRPWRRQVSITEKPRAMKRSPRRERVGPEILRLTTMARSARSASLLVGATSGRRRNVYGEVQDLRSCVQVPAVRRHAACSAPCSNARRRRRCKGSNAWAGLPARRQRNST